MKKYKLWYVPDTYQLPINNEREEMCAQALETDCSIIKCDDCVFYNEALYNDMLKNKNEVVPVV